MDVADELGSAVSAPLAMAVGHCMAAQSCAAQGFDQAFVRLIDSEGGALDA
jgi:hypothetical protein